MSDALETTSRPVRVVEAMRTQLNRERVSGAGTRQDLGDIHRLRTGKSRRQELGDPRELRRINELRHVHALGLFPRVAIVAFDRGVDVKEVACRVNREDVVAGVLRQRSFQPKGLAQFRVLPLDLGHPGLRIGGAIVSGQESGHAQRVRCASRRTTAQATRALNLRGAP